MDGNAPATEVVQPRCVQRAFSTDSWRPSASPVGRSPRRTVLYRTRPIAESGGSAGLGHRSIHEHPRAPPEQAGRQPPLGIQGGGAADRGLRAACRREWPPI